MKLVSLLLLLGVDAISIQSNKRQTVSIDLKQGKYENSAIEDIAKQQELEAISEDVMMELSDTLPKGQYQ